MLLFLILSILSYCFIIKLIFGLMIVGSRADEWEERIFEIVSLTLPDNNIELGKVVSARKQYAS